MRMGPSDPAVWSANLKFKFSILVIHMQEMSAFGRLLIKLNQIYAQWTQFLMHPIWFSHRLQK